MSDRGWTVAGGEVPEFTTAPPIAPELVAQFGSIVPDGEGPIAPSPPPQQAIPTTRPSPVERARALRDQSAAALTSTAQTKAPTDFGEIVSDAPMITVGEPSAPPADEDSFAAAAWKAFVGSIGGMVTGAARLTQGRDEFQNQIGRYITGRPEPALPPEPNRAVQATDQAAAAIERYRQTIKEGPGYEAGAKGSIFGTDVFGGTEGKFPWSDDVGVWNYIKSTAASTLGFFSSLAIPTGAAGTVAKVAGAARPLAYANTVLGLLGATGQPGMVYQKITAEVAKIPDAELQERYPFYKTLREGGMGVEAAKKASIDGSFPLLMSAATGAISNIALGGTIPGLRGNMVALPTGFWGRVGVNAAQGSAGFAAAAVQGEQAEQQTNIGMKLREGYDLARMGLAGVGGALGGALLGGATGMWPQRQARVTPTPQIDPANDAALRAANPPPEPPPPPPPPPAPRDPNDFYNNPYPWQPPDRLQGPSLQGPPLDQPTSPVAPEPQGSVTTVVPQGIPINRRGPVRPGLEGVLPTEAAPVTPGGPYGPAGSPSPWPTPPVPRGVPGSPSPWPGYEREPVQAPAPVEAPAPVTEAAPVAAAPVAPVAEAPLTPAPAPAPVAAAAAEAIPTRAVAPAQEIQPGFYDPYPNTARLQAQPTAEVQPRPEQAPEQAPAQAPAQAIATQPEPAPAAAAQPEAPAMRPEIADMSKPQLLNRAVEIGNELGGEYQAALVKLDLPNMPDAQIRAYVNAFEGIRETQRELDTKAETIRAATEPAATTTATATTEAPAPGLTRDQLGERLAELGVPAPSIRRWNKAERQANLDRLEAAAGRTEPVKKGEPPLLGLSEKDIADAAATFAPKTDDTITVMDEPAAQTETPIAALRTTDSETQAHLNDWINKTIPEGEQATVRNQIEAVLKEQPGLVDEGRSWPEIRRLAEALDERRGTAEKPAAPTPRLRTAEEQARLAREAEETRARIEEDRIAEAAVQAERARLAQAEVVKARRERQETQRSSDIAADLKQPPPVRSVGDAMRAERARAERELTEETRVGGEEVRDLWEEFDQPERAGFLDDAPPAPDAPSRETSLPSAGETKKRVWARTITKRYFEGQYFDDPARAADEFPKGHTEGPGREAEYTTLDDYLTKEIARLEDPVTLENYVNQLRELNAMKPRNRDEGNLKAARSRALEIEGRRTDREFIDSLKRMQGEIRRAVVARNNDETPTVTAPPTPRPTERKSGPWGSKRGATDEELSRPMRDLFKGKDSVSYNDLLRAFANNSYVRAYSPALAAYARQLATRLPDTLMAHRRSAGDPDANRAGYTEGEGVRLPRDDANIFFDDVLHEGTHGVTEPFLKQAEANPNSREGQILKAFQDELDRIAASRGEADINLDYARQDWHELSSMLSTSAPLYRVLSGYEGSPALRRELVRLGYPELGAKRTLWQSLVRFIRRGLGMPNSFTSVMDYALRPMRDIEAAAHKYNLDNVDASVWRMTDPDSVRKLSTAFNNEIAQAIQERFAPPRDHNGGPPLNDDGKPASLIEQIEHYGGKIIADRAWIARGAMDTLRPLILPLKTGYGLEKYYAPYFMRDGVNLIANARLQRQLTARLQIDEMQRIQPEVKRLVGELRENKAVNTMLLDATMAEVKLLSTDPNANAHLTTDVQKARLKELQDKFNTFNPEQKKLYADTVKFFNDNYAKEREARLNSIVDMIAPDAEGKARADFKNLIRTESGVNDLLTNARKQGEHSAALDIPQSVLKAVAEFHRMGFVRGDYVPGRRYGDYVLVNGDRTADNYAVEMFESRRDAESRRFQLANERDPKTGELVNPDVHQVQKKKQYYTALNSEGLTNPVIDEIVNRVTKLHGEGQGAELRNMINSIVLQNMTRSEKARTQLARENIRGASDDIGRVLAQDADAYTWRLGYLTYGLARAKALRDMRVHVSETARGITEEDRNLQAQLAEATKKGEDTTALVKLIAERAKQPKPSRSDTTIAQQVLNEETMRQPTADDPSALLSGRAVGHMTQFAYTHSLASPSNALINTTEAHLAGTGLLAAQHGKLAAAAEMGRVLSRSLHEGAGQIGSLASGVFHRTLQAKDWNIGEVMKDRLIEQNIISKEHADKLWEAARNLLIIDAGGTLARDVRRLAHHSVMSGENKAQRIWDTYQDLMAIPGHIGEETSKIVILASAFNLGMRKNKNNVDKSVAHAIDIVQQSVPNYRDKARIATPQGPFKQWSPALFQFKNYGLHMYTSVLPILIKQIFKGDMPRGEALASVGLTMAAHMTLAGTFNWLMDPLRLIGGGLDLLLGEKRPYVKPALEDAMRKGSDALMGPKLGVMVSKGLPHAAGYGVDLSRRTGVNNPFGLPDFHEYSWRDVGLGVGTLALGAPGAALADMVQGAGMALEGNVGAAAIEFAPRGIRDVLKAVNENRYGVRNTEGNVIAPANRLPYGAFAMRAAGFTPSAVSEIQSQRGNMVRVRDRTNDLRKPVYKAYGKAYLETKSQSDKDNAKRLLNLYNATYKYHPITPDDIEGYLMNQMRGIADPNTAGLTIAPTRQDLYEAGRGYNVPR